MHALLMFLVVAASAGAATREEMDAIDVKPVWQLREFFKDAQYIYLTHVEALGMHVGEGENKIGIQWDMNPTDNAVLFGKLQRLRAKDHEYQKLFDYLEAKNPKYRGMLVTFRTKLTDAHRPTNVPDMLVFDGYIRDSNGRAIYPDSGRELEYWLWGTSKAMIHRRIALEALHVFSFEQCMLMGNLVVETVPRQCMMADETVILETGDPPVTDDLEISSFDECLEKGRAIIDSFPRRCVTAGGKLYAEPARLPDGRAIMPQATAKPDNAATGAQQ